MNRPELATSLAEAFDAEADDARVVSRAAGDLLDAGRYRSDVGAPLEAAGIVTELRDAPDEADLRERWNWWIGSLEVAFGGYREFRVRERS